ncbi:MAG: hypothetical protein VX246_10190, partial [Myxococcota bacterium]|nr:hypothetical protein [Myxococcota bacterium]
RGRSGSDPRPKVRPLHPADPAPAPRPAAKASEGGGAEAAPRANSTFESPFEDELDVPTFLRKSGGDSDSGGDGDGDGGGEDRATPAFFRRAQD